MYFPIGIEVGLEQEAGQELEAERGADLVAGDLLHRGEREKGAEGLEADQERREEGVERGLEGETEAGAEVKTGPETPERKTEADHGRGRNGREAGLVVEVEDIPCHHISPRDLLRLQ